MQGARGAPFVMADAAGPAAAAEGRASRGTMPAWKAESPVQGVRRRLHLRARTAESPVQGVSRLLRLRARTAESQVQEVRRRLRVPAWTAETIMPGLCGLPLQHPGMPETWRQVRRGTMPSEAHAEDAWRPPQGAD